MNRIGLLLSGARDAEVASAMASLARKLAARGDRPVFLLPFVCDEDFKAIREDVSTVYGEKIEIVRLDSSPFDIEATPLAAKSYEAHLWLQAHSGGIDALVVPERGGAGYYELLAQHEGLSNFGGKIFCLIVCPTLCHMQKLRRLPSSVRDIETHFMEEQSVRLARGILCDDAATLEWMRQDGWNWAAKVKSTDDFAANPLDHETSRAGIPKTPPTVTVCLTHYNRPEMLRQAVESLEAQDYPNFTVILIDDGSAKPEALAELNRLDELFLRRGWRIIRQENKYLGAARNTGARNAESEYILFFDDDNYARPNMISRLVLAAQNSGADIVTASMDRFSGVERPNSETQILKRYVPLGGSAAVGVFYNCLGDAVGLIRRQKFLEIGGFSEERGVTYEDYEFYVKCVLAGFSLLPTPESLFWYRVTGDSMVRVTSVYENVVRGMRPYVQAVHPELRRLVYMLNGIGEMQRQLNQLEKVERIKQSYKESYEHIMNKPAVRAWRWLKLAMGLGGK